jgi:hypothetical protein
MRFGDHTYLPHNNSNYDYDDYWSNVCKHCESQGSLQEVASFDLYVKVYLWKTGIYGGCLLAHVSTGIYIHFLSWLKGLTMPNPPLPKQIIWTEGARHWAWSVSSCFWLKMEKKVVLLSAYIHFFSLYMESQDKLNLRFTAEQLC